MGARMRWAALVAGSLSAVLFAYACAVSTSGDCTENGTCTPPEAGAGPDAGAGANLDSPLATEDGGSSADSGSETPTEVGTEGEAAADAQGTAPDASSGDAVAEAEAEAGRVCNPQQAPSQDPCVIDELYGVFVSPGGNDANPGTRARPVRTVGQGIDIAKMPGKRVYVCAGTYTESLMVTVSRDGAAIYGALDCATWTYGAGNKVTLAPAQPGYALQVAGLLTGATFEDLEFDARDAVSPGESSVAVFIRGSQNLVLNRVVIVAGSGMGALGAVTGDGGVVGDGGGNEEGGTDAGGDASNHFGRPLDGITATTGAGAAGMMCTCPDGTSSTGGQGGTEPSFGDTAPGAGLPSYGVTGGGAAGTNMLGCNAANASGGAGADAPSHTADAPSASWGTLSATLGWTPATGTAGSDGLPGQGGGGGGSGNGAGGVGAGGGGACGGCGGAGGRPGGGGGASVALLSYQSAVSLFGCTLTARDAGNGGPGGNGEVGQAGGGGGLPNRSGCLGGGGGSGAGGNGGQGGPGGLSLGIGYLSTSPMIEGSYVALAPALAGITLGKAGAGGGNGTAGSAAPFATGRPGVDGAKGKDGTAQAVQAL